MVFINDILEELDCQAALFADDILMYQAIKFSHDTLKSQDYFTAISKWAGKWGNGF